MLFLAVFLPKEANAAQEIPFGRSFTVTEEGTYVLVPDTNQDISFRKIGGDCDSRVYITDTTTGFDCSSSCVQKTKII